MDSFEKLRTADEFSVWSGRLIVQAPAYGSLEGSAASLSRSWREQWQAKRGPDGKDPRGMLILDPGTAELPRTCIVAELMSLPMDRAYDMSTLTVTWFFDGPVGDLEARVRQKVAEISWRDHALDFEY